MTRLGQRVLPANVRFFRMIIVKCLQFLEPFSLQRTCASVGEFHFAVVAVVIYTADGAFPEDCMRPLVTFAASVCLSFNPLSAKS